MISHHKFSLHEYLFGEDQSRYLIEIQEKNKDKVINILKGKSIYFDIVGKTQKEDLEVNNEFKEKISNLSKLNSFWFKDYFEEN